LLSRNSFEEEILTPRFYSLESYRKFKVEDKDMDQASLTKDEQLVIAHTIRRFGISKYYKRSNVFQFI